MTKMFCVAGAMMLISVNIAYGIDGNSRARIDPAAVFKDPFIGVEMIFVKGGCYQMGATDDDCDASPEERPLHEACVDDFYIGKYEVTQGQWKTIMGSDTTALSTCGGNNCPIDNVSWDDVNNFVKKLNSKAVRKYRLPTEAEWEYAARSGGKSEKYSGGKDVNSVSWNADNSGKINHPVGTKAPNGLGIYDMSGNVWEMTSDWYGEQYYKHSPRKNPSGPDSGADHVVRGGCRTGGAVNQRTSRRTYIADRTKGKGSGGNVGFRLVMVP
ncbi:MAG TPA: SUMF1/EgtB/PvdO family nonheme iron enzyme [Desulfuromonadales bacterium]|nr:SUMF1/EgtB/PvdO family nonheme iron enzyme [Desulfuromonadales bacterium]